MKLHELIELAKQGKKFKAFATCTKTNGKGPWCKEDWFSDQSVYGSWLVTADWTYEEIREPIKVEWTFDNILRSGSVKIPDAFAGKPFKVTFEEM